MIRHRNCAEKCYDALVGAFLPHLARQRTLALSQFWQHGLEHRPTAGRKEKSSLGVAYEKTLHNHAGHHLAHRLSGRSVSPKILKPVRGQGRIDSGARDGPVP